MKRVLSIIILLSGCVSAIWASTMTMAVPDTGRRASLSVEVSLAAGLNTFSQRGAQVDAVGGFAIGRYISVAAGIGLRHVYSLATIDANIHGYGEADRRTYSDRFLLPLFVRLQGSIPPGRFRWAGASFVPFARLDIGYAVDLGQSALQRTASGSFFVPAVGLDFRLQNGAAWSFATGVGIYSAQYVIVDHADGGLQTIGSSQHATGNAVTLNFILGHTF